jgi:hypothetical protein
MVIVGFLFLVAAGANAQWAPIDNYLTILPYPYSTAYDFNCEYQVENGIVTYSLYLHDPVNPQFMDQGARPVANIGGFECRIETTEGVNILDWSFPVPSIDIGQDGNHIVGFSEPVPVVNGRATLATFQVFFGAATFEIPELPNPRCINHPNAWLYVKPAWIQSVPGAVAFLDYDDPDDPLIGGFCNNEDPDAYFQIIQRFPVDVEERAWGTLKALYR